MILPGAAPRVRVIISSVGFVDDVQTQDFVLVSEQAQAEAEGMPPFGEFERLAHSLADQRFGIVEELDGGGIGAQDLAAATGDQQRHRQHVDQRPDLRLYKCQREVRTI
jgi:hypothetical protein